MFIAAAFNTCYSDSDYHGMTGVVVLDNGPAAISTTVVEEIVINEETVRTSMISDMRNKKLVFLCRFCTAELQSAESSA